MRRRAEDDVVDHPDFFFVVGAFGFDDFVDFSGVFGGFAGGVEVELAFAFGEACVFEGQALLVDGNAPFFKVNAVDAIGDAREEIDGGGVVVIGEVIAGVGEFDFDILKQLCWIIFDQVMELSLGQLFSVTKAAFGFEKEAEGFQVDLDAKALRGRLGARFLNATEGFAGGETLVDLFDLLVGEFCEG